jgi:hypothetical protein
MTDDSQKKGDPKYPCPRVSRGENLKHAKYGPDAPNDANLGRTAHPTWEAVALNASRNTVFMYLFAKLSAVGDE